MPVKKIRIAELAKELGLSNKEALDLSKSMGIDVRNVSSSMEDAQADRVRRKAEREGLKRDVQPEEEKPVKKKAPAKKAAAKKADADGEGGTDTAAPAKKTAAKKAPAKKAAAKKAEPESVEPEVAPAPVAPCGPRTPSRGSRAPHRHHPAPARSR